jgi:hypothetical protein
MRRTFYVGTVWDAEAGVFYSESNIEGLHIEAASIEEFEEIMFDVAVDLIFANHVSNADLVSTPMRDLVPGIVWQRPAAA